MIYKNFILMSGKVNIRGEMMSEVESNVTFLLHSKKVALTLLN